MTIKWSCKTCGMQGEIDSPFTIRQALPAIADEHTRRTQTKCPIANLKTQNLFLAFVLNDDGYITNEGMAGTTSPQLLLFGIQ